MRCEYPDRDNVFTGVCAAKAIWIVRFGAQGYPSNEPVILVEKPYCGLHAVATLTASIAEPERHYASVQALRIENAKDMQEINARRRGIER